MSPEDRQFMERLLDQKFDEKLKPLWDAMNSNRQLLIGLYEHIGAESARNIRR